MKLALDAARLARRHPRHAVLAGLVAGLALCGAPWWAVPAAAVIGAIVLGARPAALLVVGAVLAGAALEQSRVEALDGGRALALAGRTVAADVELLEPVQRRGTGESARVRMLSGPGASDQVVLRLPPWAAPPASVAVGDVVRVRGRVVALGRFDAFQRPRGAQAALEASSVRATGRHRGGLAGALDAVRARADTAIDRGLAPAEADLLRGMVLGEDERLEEGVVDDFRASGLAHLLAVSGQNVMLLAALVLAVGVVLGLPQRARLTLAILAVAAYVPLTGAGPSIQRAGVMGVAGLVAALAGRPASRWYAVGLAAAVTLSLNPHALADPGWQLSFAAVLSLLALAPPLRMRLLRRWPATVADAAAITLAATLGTAPLMAAHFGTVSLVSIPANLLAAVLVAPIMWLGMTALAVGQLGPALAAPLLAVAAPLLVALQRIATAAASLPYAQIPVAVGPAGVAIASVLVVALAVVLTRRGAADPPAPGPRQRSRQGARVAACGLAACGLAVVLLGGSRGPGAPPAGVLRVSFLDIGQGDATLLQRSGRSILVDTGPPDGPIVTRLRQSGVRRLDLLVLTHAQTDHEGAALTVMRAFRPRIVLDGGAGWRSRVQRGLPVALAAAPARAVVPEAGQQLRVGGMRLTVLSPPPRRADWRPEGDANDTAIVSLLEAEGVSVLLTADAESNVTAALDLPPVDVLKVAHHGSEDEGLPALLERLRPRLAAIEVGRRNTFGHPRPSTLAALGAAVPTVVRTDRDGTVRLTVVRGRMRLEREGPAT